MARTVTVLPATINRETSSPLGGAAKRKVAAYARVSTDHEEQQSSYEAQCGYYTKFIKDREDWEFAGIYSDTGITETSMAKREGFARIVEDALAGKIYLILTNITPPHLIQSQIRVQTSKVLAARTPEVF